MEAPRKRARFKSTVAVVRTELKCESAFKKEIPPHEVVDETHVAHFSAWRVLVRFFSANAFLSDVTNIPNTHTSIFVFVSQRPASE